MKKPMKCLAELIQDLGNKNRAAHFLDVQASTLSRWQSGKSRPSYLAIRDAQRRGIDLTYGLNSLPLIVPLIDGKTTT
jgi:hypothetical protein